MIARKPINGGARPNAGRKKLLSPCPYCHKEFGAVDLRSHLPQCRKKSISQN
jgi:hypothetical protein